MPSMSQLQGLSVDKASLFGMPNLGAHYTPKTIEGYETNGAYVLDTDVCPLCGRRSTNVHHVVPRSVRHTFELDGHVLRSPLFGLCGHGTAGCHNGFHGGATFKAEWVWNSPRDKEAWWSGELLKTYKPHDDRLFDHGGWVIHNIRTGWDIHIRHPV